MNIENVMIALQIDGELYSAKVNGIDMDLLVNTIAALTETGKLGVVKLPNDYKIHQLTADEFESEDN